MSHVEGVATAGEIHVVAGDIFDQAVVESVVDAPQAQGRAQVTPFAGVVIDHIQNDFDACLVQGFNHLLKFVDLVTALPGAAVAAVGGKVVERVVAPVVAQPGVSQVPWVGVEVVDGQQLYGRNAQASEMVDNGWVA